MTAVVERQRASVCRARGGEGQDTCQLPGRPAAAPERPWDPSASFQLRSCTRVRSPRIKRRSVTPNRANKWQMLWISLSSVTTERLKGPGDCFHMKAASRQNHGKPLPALRTGWNWDVWSLSLRTHNKNTNRHTKAGFERFICPAHGSAEPALEIKCAVWVPLSRSTTVVLQILKVLERFGLSRPEITVVNLSPCHDGFFCLTVVNLCRVLPHERLRHYLFRFWALTIENLDFKVPSG